MFQRCLVALSAAALACQPVIAQDSTDQMLAAAAQMRAQADAMKGQLPPDQIDALLQGAREIEDQAKAGAFRGQAAPAVLSQQDVSARLIAEHGRVDWLATKTVCVGFSWENYQTFKMTTGDRVADRNPMCAEAYRHYARYFLTVRNGGPRAEAEAALQAYDDAARAAVAFYGDS